jgi:tripartite-type tricarboxylate transporter receptor subunit TctC
MRLLTSVVAMLCIGATLILPSLSAHGEEFPSRGIKIISPHPPGVATDVLGRALAQNLAESLGVPVIVEDRPGANGIIAAGTVAKADPDGYTILITSGSHIANAFTTKNLPFDVLKDFAPVTQLAASYGLALITNLPVKNVQELVALAKSKPGQLTYATNGVGNITHIAGLLFDARNGTRHNRSPIGLGRLSWGAPSAASIVLGAGRAVACPSDLCFARANLVGRSTGMIIARLNNQNRFSC